MKDLIFSVLVLFLLAACQVNQTQVEPLATKAAPSSSLSTEWAFAYPAPKEFATFPGLTSIDEFVPELDLYPWLGFVCGLYIPEKQEEEPNFVNLEFRGSTERWIPLDGKVNRTLHFEISR